MKRKINFLTLGVAMFTISSVFGYNENFGKSKSGIQDKPVAQTRGANCAPANYRLTMSFNDVSCQLETGGLLFLDRANGVATYRVPKTGDATAIYAASLWMGGTDVNGQLKLAAVTFRQDGNDFWPGPLSTNAGSGNYDPLVPQGDNTVHDYGDANVDPSVCQTYDNIFSIRKAEVVAFITWWECNNPNPFNPNFDGCEEVSAPDNEVLARITAWPGNGNITLFQDPFLAPYYDRNQDLYYNPLDGDYPWYDDILGRDDIQCGVDRRISLFGDDTHWWVFNDKGNAHTESGGQPIGMEIRAQAFSFATDDEINKMTFYNYELINRGTQTLYNTYFAQYVDSDLGNYSDDYVGCDVTRGLGYIYNGDLNDETQSGKTGYGQNPPSLGIDFFEGPYQDPDGRDNVGPVTDPNTGVVTTPTVAAAIADTGIVYKGLGIGYGDGISDNERFGMRLFKYYTSNAAQSQSDPSSAAQFYNYMKGAWRFGDNSYYGGTGFTPSAGVTTILANYMFPGDSDTLHWGTAGIDPGFDWSEFDPQGNGGASNPAGDRRFVQSAGPFTLRPGAVNNITVGIVFARSNEGSIFASVEALKRADTKAQALFDNCFRILEPPHAPVLTIQELNNELILMLDNPSQSNNKNEQYIEEDKINIDPSFTDRFYRFEGYQIFQMINDEATVADINDATKARLVAQCDVKNGVDRLVNFEFDEELGFSIPDEKVDGEDKGIRHTFRLTEDLFASGSRTLVNHKTYYYIAVAYGYNNFKDYDPNDQTKLDGQKLPYLRSRINADGTPLLAMPAVPHNPAPELGGTVQNATYGQTPRITRLDGFGNGNNALELTTASTSEILSTGYMEDPEYDYGGGPINIKVVDPLNLVGGYFECKFRDYTDIDTSSWVIYRYDQKGGSIIDSATSETTIANDNEQIIPKWGVSVQIYQNQHYVPSGSGNEAAKFTDPISSSYDFADSSKRWLSFVPDDALTFPTNWIRTGTYSPDQTTECDPLPDDYLNPCCYTDEVGKDPKEQYSKLLGGGMAPHRVTGYQCDFMPLAYPASFVSFSGSRARASISFLPSVDVVITSDKSKWTRCVIVELGRDLNLNVGGGKPGELRKSASVDKNGKKLGDAGYNASEVTQAMGMGWFPGYAIDLESGARLHMAFGENSFLGGENGADMIWNPTSDIVDNNGTPVMGGQHPIYVYGYKVGYGSFSTPSLYYDGSNDWVYDQYATATTSAYGDLFESLTWIINPVLTEGHDILETEVTIKARVNKEYKNFTATGQNGGKPMYGWSMDDIKTTTASQEQLASVLDIINVVPNPYYAFSEYERTRLDNRVKITNLPDQCTVTIYNVSGKLIRTFKKDNQVTSIDWDLKNAKGIPISSGIYIIHVDVPGVGEKIVKFFGGMRQIDLENI